MGCSGSFHCRLSHLYFIDVISDRRSGLIEIFPVARALSILYQNEPRYAFLFGVTGADEREYPFHYFQNDHYLCLHFHRFFVYGGLFIGSRADEGKGWIDALFVPITRTDLMGYFYHNTFCFSSASSDNGYVDPNNNRRPCGIVFCGSVAFSFTGAYPS